MKKSLQQRILEELVQFPDGRAPYHALMYKLWPPNEWPRAYRNSSNGGPPGVAMVYGAALSKMRINRLIFRFNPTGARFGQEEVCIAPDGRKRIQ